MNCYIGHQSKWKKSDSNKEMNLVNFLKFLFLFIETGNISVMGFNGVVLHVLLIKGGTLLQPQIKC